jgi:hypothetical protein
MLLRSVFPLEGVGEPHGSDGTGGARGKEARTACQNKGGGGEARMMERGEVGSVGPGRGGDICV